MSAVTQYGLLGGSGPLRLSVSREVGGASFDLFAGTIYNGTKRLMASITHLPNRLVL